MALTKVPSNLDSVTATTQSASDNSTNVATTAYVTTAINNLIDGAPSTLNTLDEIAAALNDDAALNTTLTNSIATKLPLAGGDLTGRLTITGSDPNDNVNRVLNISDDRAMAADVGGSISFFGKYQGSSYSTYGQILGVKENGTSGNYAGYLAFKTRSSSALPSERMRIDSDGNVGIGMNPAGYGKLSVNGTGVIVALRASSGAGTLGWYEGGAGRFYLKSNNGSNGLTFVDGDSTTNRMVISSSGHITPGADNTQDFGSNSARWRNIYSADLQLSNVDTGGNDVDGSEGSWTIQEGENDLFIINRKNGKKYKFNLEEVE